jgi:hypothetical protein
LVTVALLLAGCSNQPGSAATVAGQAIPEQSVLDRTSAYLAQTAAADPTQASNPAEVDLINRRQASDLIRHQLVLYAERDQQTSVSQTDINSLITAQGGADTLAQNWSVPANEVNDLAHDLLVLEKLLQKASGTFQVTDVSITVDYVTATSRDAAVAARTKYLASPSSMAADIALAGSNGGQAGAPFEFVTTPDLASLGLYSVPAGSIVIAPLQPPTFLVARVVTRAEKQTVLTASMLSAVQSASGQLILASTVLGPTEAKAGVSLNPRFGRWDSTVLQAVPSNDGV